MQRALFLICGAYFLGTPIASALPFWNPGDQTVLVHRVGTTDCRGPIASEAHPGLEAHRQIAARGEAAGQIRVWSLPIRSQGRSGCSVLRQDLPLRLWSL